MKKLSLALALFIGLFLVYANASAEERTFTVQGGATVEKANMAQAKAAALIDADKKAITQALNQSLGEKMVQDKAAIIKEHFFKDPAKFVNRFRINSENPTGEVYTVEVEVELDLPKIHAELVQAGLDRAKNQSVVLAVIEEEGSNNRSAWVQTKPEQSYAENLLSPEIQRWGYRLAKPEAALDPQKIDKYLSDKAWLAQLGDKYNAEFLVLGEEKIMVEKKELSQDQKGQIKTTEEGEAGVFAATADLELTVVNLTSGDKETVHKPAQTGIDNQLSEARSKATDLAIRAAQPELSLMLEKLSRKITVAGTEKNTRAIIDVLGVSSWYQYQELMDGLKKADCLASLQLWGFAPGEVKVSISFSGDRDAVRKQVSGCHFSEFKLLPIEGDKQDFRFKLETVSQ